MPCSKWKVPKPVRPKFNQNALVAERLSLPRVSPQQQSEKLQTSPQTRSGKPLSTRRSANSSKQSEQMKSMDEGSKAVHLSTVKKTHPLAIFGQKSHSLARSSQQVSVSSEQLKKHNDIETPQFRRSLISNRKKSQTSNKAD